MKFKRVLFVTVIFISMIISGSYALINQSELNISYLENRELSYIKPFNIKSWLDKEFQSSVDNAITDNLFGRDQWIKYYNKINLRLDNIGNRSISILFNKKTDKKIVLQDINEKISYIDDISYLVGKPYTYEEEIDIEISKNIEKIERLSYENKGIKFYIYLPLMANEHDIFATSDSNNSYLRLFNHSKVPVKKLEVNNVKELKETYFSTDHHWSHVGSYRGYRDIIDFLLQGTEKVKEPDYEKKFKDVKFFGSHSRAIAHAIDIKGDSISKYIFDLPEYELNVDGEFTEEYGHYKDYINGSIDMSQDFDHYNWMYQSRKGEIIFDTKRENLENILIISDSMSNPIRDVLSSHFNKTIFINLDEYQRNYGNFKIEDYIEEYNLDKILVIVVLANYFPDGELKNLK